MGRISFVAKYLPEFYASRLRGFYVGDEKNSSQSSTHARVIELALAEASSRPDTAPDPGSRQPPSHANPCLFAHVFVLRLDMLFHASNLTCLLQNDTPKNAEGMGMTNPDQFSYLPGRYFECAARYRNVINTDHDSLDKLLALAGDPFDYSPPGSAAPVSVDLVENWQTGPAYEPLTACPRGSWSFAKHTGEQVWQRAERDKSPPDGDRIVVLDAFKRKCHLPRRDYFERRRRRH